VTVEDALLTEAVDVLLRLEDSGFDLDLVGVRLLVKPAGRLSATQRSAIARHREALIVLVRHCLAVAGRRSSQEAA
jgi:hypothetical protein